MNKAAQDVKFAILKSMAREKEPPKKRFLKAMTFSSLIAILLISVICLFFWEQLNGVWIICLVGWGSLLFLSFYWLLGPSPRIEVPGWQSRWVDAKILSVMTTVTILELLICPHFVMLTPSKFLNISAFEMIRFSLMSSGGMAFCMLGCGIIFVGILSAVGFLSVRRTASRFKWSLVARLFGFGLLTQIPIFYLQISNSHLRPFVVYWALGALLGLVLGYFISRATSFISSKISTKKIKDKVRNPGPWFFKNKM